MKKKRRAAQLKTNILDCTFREMILIDAYTNAKVEANRETRYQDNKLEVGTPEETPRIRSTKPVTIAKVLGAFDGKGYEITGCATDSNMSLKCVELSYPAPKTHKRVSRLITATTAKSANPDVTNARYLIEESNFMF